MESHISSLCLAPLAQHIDWDPSTVLHTSVPHSSLLLSGILVYEYAAVEFNGQMGFLRPASQEAGNVIATAPPWSGAFGQEVSGVALWFLECPENALGSPASMLGAILLRWFLQNGMGWHLFFASIQWSPRLSCLSFLLCRCLSAVLTMTPWMGEEDAGAWEGRQAWLLPLGALLSLSLLLTGLHSMAPACTCRSLFWWAWLTSQSLMFLAAVQYGKVSWRKLPGICFWWSGIEQTR